MPRDDIIQVKGARLGVGVSRVDGRLKVTGQARYGADMTATNPAYAVLVTSAIACGRIVQIDDGETRSIAGVLDVFTYRNVGNAIKPGKISSQQGHMGTSIAPLQTAEVHHDGEIVAMVVADTFEAASDAAFRLKIKYEAKQPASTFDSPGVTTSAAKDVDEKHKDSAVGDAPSAFETAAVKIDAHYETPAQHHNPIELFTTLCAWEDGKLTVWESSQFVYGLQAGLAEQLGIKPENIHVISPFIGGAFGSRGAMTQRTALVAYAASLLNRPVKLAATRTQGFTIATYRAETRHRVRLGAGVDGKLTALIHEGWEMTSRPDNYFVGGTDASTRLYACPNISSKVSIVNGDRNTPGFMRAPPEVPYLFALESAMDELAIALKIDPIELRRRNDTANEPIKGLPYTSRNLMACFDAGAQAFGWERRSATPAGLREGDWLIGMGCASTMYPTQMGAATARLTLYPNATLRVQTAAHEIGNGIYTAAALTAADAFGLPIEAVIVELGDTRLPPAPVAGGSNTTASVCNVIAKACAEMKVRLTQATGNGPLAGQDLKTLTFSDGLVSAPNGAHEPLADITKRMGGAIEVYAENIPHGVKPDAVGKLYAGAASMAGGAKLEDRIQFAFGAEFVEVRVHARTGEIRAPRALGAFAAGRIVNPKAAESQLTGGLIWGLSSALHEATEIDRRAGRYYNTNLAEYLIPVNADVTEIRALFLPETDTQINDLGIKGLGELGNVGTNAAVANAVYNATGVRVRELPIRLEKLLPALSVV